MHQEFEDNICPFALTFFTILILSHPAGQWLVVTTRGCVLVSGGGRRLGRVGVRSYVHGQSPSQATERSERGNDHCAPVVFYPPPITHTASPSPHYADGEALLPPSRGLPGRTRRGRRSRHDRAPRSLRQAEELRRPLWRLHPLRRTRPVRRQQVPPPNPPFIVNHSYNINLKIIKRTQKRLIEID